MFNIQNNRFAMKVKEFEDAIKRMDSRIVLDEVKLSKGQVRRFYGNIGNKLIMWDGDGIASTCTVQEPEEIDHETHEGVLECFYDPDHKYDIHFENIYNDDKKETTT